MARIKTIFVIALVLLSCGCKSGYEKFYQSNTFEKYPKTDKVLVKHMSEDMLKLYTTSPPRGYVLVGTSGFFGPYEKADAASRFARSVGADEIWYSTVYRNTRVGAMPMTTPTYSNSYISGMAGGTPYSGSISTYGTRTTYMPYSVEVYNHFALFLRKIDRTEAGGIFSQ